MEQNILLSRNQTAELLGLSPATLAVWASTKRYNLPYVKIGSLVRYRMADINSFIQQQIN